MPILTVIGLILMAIKTAIALSDYLKDHPEVHEGVKEALVHVGAALDRAHENLTIAVEQHIEAP